MGFLIALLTVVLVLDCVVLMFLVLIQLPKKDAGAGLAFGAGATDALFGAGSGNVLTKITKYAAAGFFVLAILLAVMQRKHASTTSEFEKQLQKAPSTAPAQPGPANNAPAPTPSATPAATPVPAGTNVLLSTPAPVPGTNAPTPEAPK
jgi:protein translocase SecG subunit